MKTTDEDIETINDCLSKIKHTYGLGAFEYIPKLIKLLPNLIQDFVQMRQALRPFAQNGFLVYHDNSAFPNSTKINDKHHNITYSQLKRAAVAYHSVANALAYAYEVIKHPNNDNFIITSKVCYDYKTFNIYMTNDGGWSKELNDAVSFTKSQHAYDKYNSMDSNNSYLLTLFGFVYQTFNQVEYDYFVTNMMAYDMED